VFENVTSERLRTALARACTAAGIPSFSPHDLRHRRVSLLHLNGMPWARIGELVGHDDLMTTARTYTHVVADERQLDYAVCSTDLPVVSEPEDEREGLVDGAEFINFEASGGAAESLWVDDRRLLDEDACLFSLERDRRTEARRPGARRRRRNENGAKTEELVGLDDNRVTSPALFVPARATRRRQVEELAADHVSP
jgi:hypothetical protein